MQTILCLKQDKPELILMEREAPSQWQETKLTAADDSFLIAGETVTLQQIYRDVFL